MPGMARREGPKVAASPERPIEDPTDDKLERSSFVDRLCDAVIDGKTQRSKGVVIGVTGPWGSGKSSILNLLQRRIKARYSGAIILHFDPWLISGRDDLIARFIDELRSEIGETHKSLSGLVSALAAYGEQIAPVGNYLVPGAGAVARGLFGRIKISAAKRSGPTLEQVRNKIRCQLGAFSSPFVVLIDEVDRLDDQEIKVICQLVRSVMDFPNISYVLAYDSERVIQALGATSTFAATEASERRERGRSYLEKIVQFAFPLPIAFDNEIIGLLNAEVSSFADELELPEHWGSEERYQELLRKLVPKIIATPRDVKKVAGTYRVVAGAARGEVDWIDLLGLCALMVKAPQTTERIRAEPDAVVSNPITFAGDFSLESNQEEAAKQRHKFVNPEEEGGEPIRSLLAHLFPMLSSGGAYRDPPPNAICLRRPLLVVLRYGLLPGETPREEIEQFLQGSQSDMEEYLKNLIGRGQIGAFLDRLEDVFGETEGRDDEAFWLATSNVLQKPTSDWPTEYSNMHEIVRTFARMFEREYLYRTNDPDQARHLFQLLWESGDKEMVSLLVRSHLFQHSLFGLNPDHRDRKTFLKKEEAEQHAKEMAVQYQRKHRAGVIIPVFWQLNTLYTAVDTGLWNEACREKLHNDLLDTTALDGLTLMLFGGVYSTDRSMLDRILDTESYLQRVRDRLEDSATEEAHPTVRAALKKALEGW